MAAKGKAARQKNAAHELELRAWWMGEMIKTPSPLTERMTLFWHNHFVSSTQKVPFAQLMYRQNVLLRQDAPWFAHRPSLAATLALGAGMYAVLWQGGPMQS